MQEERDKRQDFVAKARSEMEKAVESVQKSLSGVDEEVAKVAYEMGSHKKYTMDLAKNMGFQMHTVVENQNAVLGENNKKFNDFENRIAIQIQEKFEKLSPMIEEL